MDDGLFSRHHDTPLDDAAVAGLAAGGLQLRLVADDDRAGFDRWLDAVSRGFLHGERTDIHHQAAFERLGYRRKIGVFDDRAPVADVPVATFASWLAELSVPGAATVPACAISSVTVAPTHRRQGIARAMMDGELRRAAQLGVPVAMLTVSESTIYGRYGFAPAAAAASWTIDARRARWIGSTPAGRVDFIPRERLRDLAPGLHERWRTGSPGEIEMPGGHWDRIAGTHPDADKPGDRRAVQYSDAGGVVRGLAVYSVTENDDDFTGSSVQVAYLLAEDADAYAGLWRFLLEMDLIAEVSARELSVDEPLLWMISDQRAAKVTVQDHQYVRILDVTAALERRRYAAAGTLALEVHDPLGIAGGRFILRVDDTGWAAVTPWEDDAPEGAVLVRLGIAELSAVYLGTVSLATLAAAGRVDTSDAAAAARVMSWHVAARLSFWY